MDINYVKKSGHIISCTIEGKIKKANNVITVADKDLPEDFLVMFPLGKYLIKKAKVTEDRNFKMPELQPPKSTEDNH